MQRIILLGAGPHAQVVADIVEREGRYAIAGVTDTTREVGDGFLDYEVIGRQDDIAGIMQRHDVRGGLVCLGDNFQRADLADLVYSQAPSFEFVRAIHPGAVIARGVDIGDGTAVMAGCVVNTGATVGRHCLLNTRSVLEHHGRLDDFASLGPGVTTGGHFRLGRHSAMGIGAVAAERVTVGANSVIGAGSVLLDDIGDDVLAVGSPARVVRTRKPGERFLK